MRNVADAVELSRIIRAGFAHCSLGEWPTPLETWVALGDELRLAVLWAKREDRSSRRYGGNKVRGLEFLLRERGDGSVCVTIGGSGSTHCLATAVHGRALGWRTVVAQFSQFDTPLARAVAMETAAWADIVVTARTHATFVPAVVRAWRAARRLGRRHWIPGGGAHPRAVLGHVLAALELEQQLPAPPDALVVPLGSGGTAAGLSLGLSVLGWPTRVVAARVAPRLVANRWRVGALERKAGALLAGLGIRARRDPLPPIIVHVLGGGYGRPTREGEKAQRLAAAAGLTLDATYGAKAFAALAGLPQRGFRRVVFWHTFAPPSSTPGSFRRAEVGP